MATLDLQTFKQHVRADDFDADDPYLEHLLETAAAAVLNEVSGGTGASELMADGELLTVEMPRPLVQAVMMLAAHWYNQRESVSPQQMHEVPSALMALIKPYRRFVLPSSPRPS